MGRKISKNDRNAEANSALMSEIGLGNRQSRHQLTFVRSYSEVTAVSRVDSEYFQPKYDEIVDAVKNYSGGWDRLENLVSIRKCVEVGRAEYMNEGIPFIRVSNLSRFGISEEKYISEELYQKLRMHQPKKGEILYTKDGTPGIAYYLNEEPQRMIPSSGVLRLKLTTDRISGNCLTVILNSFLVREQVNRDVGGSIILHWRPDQVEGVVVPILSESIQQVIEKKASESFNLRARSESLLKSSMNAVEIAVVENEKAAMESLRK